MTTLLLFALLAGAEPMASSPQHLSEFTPAQLDGAVVDAVTAMRCGDQALVRDAKKDMADELRSARQGAGVVDAKQLHDDQDTVRNAEGNAAHLRAWLKRSHFKSPSCEAANVHFISRCLGHVEEGGDISWFVEPGPECKGLPEQIIRAALERLGSD